MHFFFSYEHNRQAMTRVYSAGHPPRFAELLREASREPSSPFRSDLFFGKIDYQSIRRSYWSSPPISRDASEIRDFGGQNSYKRPRT